MIRFIFIILIGLIGCNDGGGSSKKKSKANTDDKTKSEEADDTKASKYHEKKYPLVVLGDSISAAMLAPSNIGSILPDSVIRNLLSFFSADPNELVQFLDGTKHVTVEEIGDRVSWKNTFGAFSGTKPWSHRKRLQALGQDVSAYNLAIIGARVADSQKQIDMLDTKYKEGLRNNGYIVFEFGANDFCQQTDLNDFKNSFEAQLNKVISMHKGAVIAVVAVPNVPQLFSITSDSEVASKLEGEDVNEFLGGPKSYTCEKVRAAFSACPVMSTAVNVAQRQTDMNAIIDQVVKDVDKKGNTVVFASAVGTAAFTRDHIAGDCFHPSEAGQEFLSNLVWDAVKDKF
jgi:lysophospholipase L1-like esterase